MITLKIEGKEFKIKSDWSEISFDEFVNYLAISQDTYSEVMKFVKILTEFSNSKQKDEFEKLILKLGISDFNVLKENFKWLSEDITNHPDYKKTKSFFVIDGVKYKMKENYNQFSVGEMVTLETLLRDKVIDATHLELSFAILFRRVDENGKEVEFNIDDFLFVLKNMKSKVRAIDVISHINFFLTGEKIFTKKNSKDSSTLQILKTNTKECQKKKLKNTKKTEKKN